MSKRPNIKPSIQERVVAAAEERVTDLEIDNSSTAQMKNGQAAFKSKDTHTRQRKKKQKTKMEGKSETGTFRPSGADAGDKNSGVGAEGAGSRGRILKLAEKLRGKTGCNDGNRCSVLGRRRIRGEGSQTHQDGRMGGRRNDSRASLACPSLSERQ